MWRTRFALFMEILTLIISACLVLKKTKDKASRSDLGIFLFITLILAIIFSIFSLIFFGVFLKVWGESGFKIRMCGKYISKNEFASMFYWVGHWLWICMMITVIALGYTGTDIVSIVIYSSGSIYMIFGLYN